MIHDSIRKLASNTCIQEFNVRSNDHGIEVEIILPPSFLRNKAIINNCRYSHRLIDEAPISVAESQNASLNFDELIEIQLALQLWLGTIIGQHSEFVRSSRSESVSVVLVVPRENRLRNKWFHSWLRIKFIQPRSISGVVLPLFIV